MASSRTLLFCGNIYLSKTQTLPVACARLMTEYGIVWGQVMTTGTILVAPVLFLGIVIRKYLVRGLTMGAIR